MNFLKNEFITQEQKEYPTWPPENHSGIPSHIWEFFPIHADLRG